MLHRFIAHYQIMFHRFIAHYQIMFHRFIAHCHVMLHRYVSSHRYASSLIQPYRCTFISGYRCSCVFLWIYLCMSYLLILTYPIDWGAYRPFSQAIPTFNMTTPLSTQLTVSESHPRSSLAVSLPIGPSQESQYPLDLPPRLVKKILNLEYVDIAELLPEYWELDESESHCCGGQPSRSSRRGPITNILVWLDGYSSLVSVLCSAYPHKFHHFMAYQRTIIRAHRRFVGDRWVIYDASYRRAAAHRKSLDWGIKDQELYSETFTGRAKAIDSCSTCLSELHRTTDCPRALQVPISIPSSSQALQDYPTESDTTFCFLFNHRDGDRCTFVPCKYGHFCRECKGRHPVSRCPKFKRFIPSSQQTDKRPRRKY